MNVTAVVFFDVLVVVSDGTALQEDGFALASTPKFLPSVSQEQPFSC